MNMLEMIAEIRGGIPNKCDFCHEQFTEENYPTPEEAGDWACISCVKVWLKQDELRKAQEK